MSPYIEYVLKVSIGMMVVSVFYHVVLRKYTFFNWNRWYLLGYSLLTFLIPFINIDHTLKQVELADHAVVQAIPVVQNFAVVQAHAQPVPVEKIHVNYSDIVLFILLAGGLIMLVRVVLALLSYYKLRNKAHLISDGDVKVFQVEKNITPFSFGNSIFLNRNLHDDVDLKEIMLHEFVHVKQKHTIDIIWSEVLCILNWYNPFAWIIRSAIRQNLEYIADRAVLENGVDAKAYQYLLLKVVGVPEFRIANQFNFSSLKQRIVMMNKMKTARIQLIRFLFVLPLISVLLVAFRSEVRDTFTSTATENNTFCVAGILVDGKTGKPIANAPIKVETTEDVVWSKDDKVGQGNTKNVGTLLHSDGRRTFIRGKHLTTILTDEDGFYYYAAEGALKDSIKSMAIAMEGYDGRSFAMGTVFRGGVLRYGHFVIAFLGDKSSNDFSNEYFHTDQDDFFKENVNQNIPESIKAHLLNRKPSFEEEYRLKQDFKRTYKEPKNNLTKFGKGYFDQSHNLIGYEGITEIYLDGQKVDYHVVNNTARKDNIRLMNKIQQTNLSRKPFAGAAAKLFYLTYQTNLEAPPKSYLKKGNVEWIDATSFDLNRLDSEPYFLDGFRQIYGVGSNMKPLKEEIKRVAVFKGKLARYYDKKLDKVLWIETRPVDEVFGRPEFASK
jgi:beta-lactamase regulating signal transducer with metallopeptidase domain